jgi:hypothetical protein
MVTKIHLFFCNFPYICEAKSKQQLQTMGTPQ